MRALTVSTFGDPDALHVEDVPVPEPGPGQVRIRVEAATVNPVDLGTRAGVFETMLPPRPRYTLGWDVAGRVDATGAGTPFAVGEHVVGLSEWFRTLAGTQAEYVVLDASAVARGPAGVSAAEAATLPLNGLTAARALDQLDLRPGQILAINGAAGAVGGYAVQLAAHRGLRVIGLAGVQDEAAVRGFGAVEFVARGGDPAAAVRAVAPDGVDGALDTYGGGADLLGALRDGGALVTSLPPSVPAPVRGIRAEAVLEHDTAGRLAELVALVEAGVLTQRVARTYSLEEATAAHERLAKGGVRGRLVLVP